MREWAPLHVEDDVDGGLVVYSGGDVRRDIAIYPTREQYEQMKQGYMCVRCFGLVDSSFPETCGLPGCDGYPNGFPMRERQQQVMESEMRDEVRSPEREQSQIWTPN